MDSNCKACVIAQLLLLPAKSHETSGPYPVHGDQGSGTATLHPNLAAVSMLHLSKKGN